MITAHDPNDLDSPRTARHLASLEATEPNHPDHWDAWRAILVDRRGESAEQINVVPRNGFGTVCSSYVALVPGSRPLWLFAAGPPHATAYEPVTIG